MEVSSAGDAACMGGAPAAWLGVGKTVQMAPAIAAAVRNCKRADRMNCGAMTIPLRRRSDLPARVWAPGTDGRSGRVRQRLRYAKAGLGNVPDGLNVTILRRGVYLRMIAAPEMAELD